MIGVSIEVIDSGAWRQREKEGRDEGDETEVTDAGGLIASSGGPEQAAGCGAEEKQKAPLRKRQKGPDAREGARYRIRRWV